MMKYDEINDGNASQSAQAGTSRLYRYEKFREDWLATTLREQKVHCSDPANLNAPWDCRPWFDYRPMAEDTAKLEAMLDTLRNTSGTIMSLQHANFGGSSVHAAWPSNVSRSDSLHIRLTASV
jgi:hypothetical protein